MMKPRTASAKASKVTRSRIFVMLRLDPRQVGEKIERAGHEHRAMLAGERERGAGIGLDRDLVELVRREVRKLRSRERALVRRLRRDEAAPHRGERREHRD